MDKHLNGSASREEEKQLFDWYDFLQQKETEDQLPEAEGIAVVLEKIQSRIAISQNPKRTCSMWIRIAAAFFIILFSVYSGLIIFNTDKSNTGPNTLTERPNSVVNLSLERRDQKQ